MCDDKTRALLYARAAQIQEVLAAKRRRKDDDGKGSQDGDGQPCSAGSEGHVPPATSPVVTASHHATPPAVWRRTGSAVRWTRSSTGSTAAARSHLQVLINTPQRGDSERESESDVGARFSSPLGFYPTSRSLPRTATDGQDFTLPDDDFLQLKRERCTRSMLAHAEPHAALQQAASACDQATISLTLCAKFPTPKDVRRLLLLAGREHPVVMTTRGLYFADGTWDKPAVSVEGGADIAVAPDDQHIWATGGDETGMFCLLLRASDLAMLGVHWFPGETVTAVCPQLGTSAVVATAQGSTVSIVKLAWTAANAPFGVARLPTPDNLRHVTSLVSVRPKHSTVLGIAGDLALFWDSKSGDLTRQVRLRSRDRDSPWGCIGAFCQESGDPWPCFLLLRAYRDITLLAVLGPGQGARQMFTFEPPQGTSAATAVAADAGQGALVCGTDKGTLLLWNLQSRACVAQLCEYPSAVRIRSVSVHPSLPLVAALSDHGGVHVYALPPGA